MTRKQKRNVILATTADFFTGMSTAWAFAAVDSLNHFAWSDLLSSVFLATLSLTTAISIKLKL